MADPVKVQTLVTATQATNTTTDLTQAITLTAGTTLIIYIGVNNFSAASVTCTCTGSGNTPASEGYLNSSSRHLKIYSMVVTTGGAQTLTFGKAGNSGALGAVTTEWSGSAGVNDGGATFATASGTAATVTMTATTVRNDALMVGYVSNNPITMGSAQSGWTNDANDTTNAQMATAYQLPNATGTYTAGWPSITNSFSRPYVVGAIALKGIAVDPTVTGGTANPVHLSTGNTITGSNFGASQGAGTLVIGGVTQTVTAWGYTSITYTADRGTNLDDVAVNAVVTDDNAVSSNSYALTGFDPPSGYSYVTLTSVWPVAAERIQSVLDLAIGNQIEWDDATIDIDASGVITWPPGTPDGYTFNARIGVSGDGWGATEVQTFNPTATTGGTGVSKLRYPGMSYPSRLGQGVSYYDP